MAFLDPVSNVSGNQIPQAWTKGRKGVRTLKQFSDISLDFEANPVTGDLSKLKDSKAITNSIKNLILTIPGEAPFDSSVGSSVTAYLFEPFGQQTSNLLKIEIKDTIDRHEPRVELVSVEVDSDEKRNAYTATITYKIIGYEQVFTFTQTLRPTRY